jgi:uncharacterized membrane protein HdeD (DUF308 family)
MNKVISFSILYASLFFTETASCFLMLFLDSSNFKGNFDGAVLWNFWRVLFLGIPFIVLYFLLFKYVGNIKLYKPLLFSLFNLLIYVGLSVLSRVIWGKNVPLPPEGILFWVSCISIIISPIILGQIPYFKKLMESL